MQQQTVRGTSGELTGQGTVPSLPPPPGSRRSRRRQRRVAAGAWELPVAVRRRLPMVVRRRLPDPVRFGRPANWRVASVVGALALAGMTALLIASQVQSRPSGVVLDPGPRTPLIAPAGPSASARVAAPGLAPSAVTSSTEAARHRAVPGRTTTTAAAAVTRPTTASVVPTSPATPTSGPLVVRLTGNGTATASRSTAFTSVGTVAPSATGRGGAYYADCAAARAAGAAPLFEGDPGYRPGLDPSGSGVACP